MSDERFDTWSPRSHSMRKPKHFKTYTNVIKMIKSKVDPILFPLLDRGMSAAGSALVICCNLFVPLDGPLVAGTGTELVLHGFSFFIQSLSPFSP